MLGSRIRSDKYYVKQVLKGRQEAYAVLVDRYLPVLHAVVAARVDVPGDVDDAVQDTFVRAYRSLHSLEKIGSFGAWISTIARRTAYKYHRQRKRQREAQHILQRTTEEAWSRATESEGLEILRSELDRLPEEERELLLMRYFAGKSVREVAQLSGITPAAAAKRLQRAREALGERIVATLAQVRMSEERNEQRRRAVMSLIGPLPLPVLKASAVQGAVAGATALTLLKVAGVCVVVAVVVATALTHMGHEQESAQPDISSAVTTGEVVIEHEARDPAEDEGAEAVPAAPSDRRANTPDLSGEWELVIPAQAESARDPDRFALVAEYKDDGLMFTSSDPRFPSTPQYIGTVRGRSLVLNFVRNPDGMRFKGYFDHRFTVAPLAAYAGDTPVNGDVPVNVAFLARPGARIPWPRTDRNIAQEANPRKEHAELLSRALRAYYEAHDGLLPAALTALHPAYLADASDVEPQPGREMIYHPQNALPAELPAVSVNPDMFDENLPLADRLMMCEQTLERESMVADIVFPKPILEITYSGDTPARYVVYNAGKPGAFVVRDETERLLPDAGDVQRISCQGNLKQIGLVIKMFQNEQPEDHSPPGWLYVYPEYVTDPQIFWCPFDPLGIDSYHYLFPATQLAALADQLGCTEAELPVVMDRDPGHTPGGRNVLFADGHVSFVKSGSPEWQQQIVPFLALAAP